MGSQARAKAALKRIQQDAAKPRKPRVAIGFVHDNAGRVSSFEDSLWALVTYDQAHENLITEKITVRFGTDGLPAARNTMAARFLQSDNDWLLMVDTDMGFGPDSLYKLIEAAHPEKRPIVGGLCFTNREIAHDGLFGYRTRPTPTIFDWKEDPQLGVPGFVAVMMYPTDAVVRCAGTGAAFLLIHRSVFERIAQTVIPGTDGVLIGPRWFDRTPDAAGKLLGEDLSFCVRANLAQIPIHVHTGVKTTHFKEIWLGEADHWFHYAAPTATDEVAVIVPVLRRPQNAAPFMQSLRASTGLARVYAVADEDDPDTIQAWRDAGAEVIVDNVRTFPRKVNLGYHKTSEPWIFVCGDDVKFWPGWLDHAQHAADMLEADVVGTNDLGSERSLRGEHSGHILIRRSYIDQVGASWDGPGIVCHEGYMHKADEEIAAAAKARGKWQMALGSRVEHRHPMWGKGDDDEVYRLGEASTERDLALFRERLQQHLRR